MGRPDEDGDTTYPGDNTNQIFDSDYEDEFDSQIDGDDVYIHDNMDWG
jgi:hypothetical protein